MKKLLRSKRFWTGVAAIATAVGGYFGGDINMGQLVQTVMVTGGALIVSYGFKIPGGE